MGNGVLQNAPFANGPFPNGNYDRLLAYNKSSGMLKVVKSWIPFPFFFEYFDE